MKILGIETAAAVGGAALLSDGAVLGEICLGPQPGGTRIGEGLLETVDRLLTDHDLAPADLDGIAVSIGPGSLTGIRIGVALVKGLAHGSRTRVVPISTLHALAVAVSSAGEAICPVMDAKRGEVFAAAFQRESGGLVRRLPDSVFLPEQLVEEIVGEVLLTGEGLEIHGERLLELFGPRARVADRVQWGGRPAHVAWLGGESLASARGASLEELAPAYLRPSSAELNWQKKTLK